LIVIALDDAGLAGQIQTIVDTPMFERFEPDPVEGFRSDTVSGKIVRANHCGRTSTHETFEHLEPCGAAAAASPYRRMP
jgi:hypothetical protein